MPTIQTHKNRLYTSCPRMDGGLCCALLALLCISTTSVLADNTQTGKQRQRIVSINLCADELVLLLAKPADIVSVSYNGKAADKTIYAGKAQRYRANHGRVEELLSLQPSLVVTSEYSSRYTKSMLRNLKIPVAEVGYIQSISKLKQEIRKLAQRLDRTDAGRRLIQRLDKEFIPVTQDRRKKKPTVLIYHVGGWIKKPPSLAHELVTLAGLYNITQDFHFQSWGQLSLEQLLVAKPDYLIILSNHQNQTSLAHKRLHHPVFRYYRRRGKIIWIADKWLSCGSPAILHALNKIKQQTRQATGAKP